jgi:putative sigma-54 modulation protein
LINHPIRGNGYYNPYWIRLNIHAYLKANLLKLRRIPMRINFTARHYKPSPRLKEYAQNEVLRLEKFYDGIISCEIVLDYQKDIQIAEIQITVYGQILTVVEKTDDIYKSIDLAVEKMGRKLKRYKEKKFKQYTENKVAAIKT